MKMTVHHLTLPLEHPFTISRGTITHQRSVVVELEHQGVSGFGEVTENSFYGQDVDTIAGRLATSDPLLRDIESSLTRPDWPGRLWQAAADRWSPDTFALSALDMAACDLWGRLTGRPGHELWGLQWNDVPSSSYTIGIAPIEQMIDKLRERPDWPIYKIKLGTPDDVAIVRRLREETDAVFRVDANCAWSADQTIEFSPVLKDLGTEFIEQPLPITASDEDKRRAFRHSALPLIADEDCQVESDVLRCRDFYHGINVKLCKCGGPTPAVRMLRRARSLEMQTMVGCMIESSIGISMTAQLLPLLDHADLDGAVLLRRDPAEGVSLDRGKVTLSGRSGTGSRLRQESPDATTAR